MCAIAGIIRFESDAAAPVADVRAMLRKMAHRGPDGSQVFESQPCVLGANRLAQLDRAGGNQPMHSPDGRWVLVFNGEIHNHRDVRRQLEPHWQFRTRSDTEVVLAALVIWGEDALDRLNGMFAFFLWDTVERRGMAARDRLGVKPFVWCRLADGFAFASEAKALLEILPGRPNVNRLAVMEYFAAPCFSGVEAPMFDGMHHLLPGQLLTLDAGRIDSRTWWTHDLRRAVCDDEDDLRERMHGILSESTALTLDADEPAAVLLSGGLDSTLVAACAKDHGVECAYTVAFEGQAEFDYAAALMVKSDDLPWAADAAREIGLRHRIVPVSRATLAEDLRTLAVQNDALPAWEQELAQHHLARAVAQDYRALLVGDGADETHYGYGFMLDDEAIRDPRHLLHRFGDPPLTKEMEHEATALARRYTTMVREAGHGAETRADRLRGITDLIVRRWLPRLLHNGDIHTMAHGVEARVPFADSRLLELAVQVHPLLALQGGVEKHLLRGAARGLMPEAPRLRRKSSLSKDDACAAIYQREAAEAVAASAALLRHWLDLPSVSALCDPARVPTEMERALLFRVICFHHWANAHQICEP